MERRYLAMIHSHTDYDNLLKIINRSYRVSVNQMSLYRDMIGRVYFSQGVEERYVLKIYRPFHTDNALNSIRVLDYLGANDYPVVSIVPTIAGEPSITIETPEGHCTGILYDYVLGTEPVLETEIAKIGLQVGRLHGLMARYPHRLPERGKLFYIDRYISALKAREYPPGRIDELEAYGKDLWKRMEQLPRGFCHGDLHSGNMLKTESGEYVLFDFDVASRAYPVIDVATLSDCTDFNDLNSVDYDRTMRRFTEFYGGYNQVSTISDDEIDTIVDFIAIRHYEIISTIVSCQGLQGLSKGFMDEQYEWLLQWKDTCEKKRGSAI